MMKNFTKLVLLFAFSFFATAAMAQITYVDANATGANNGTSWADAYINVQDGIDATAAGFPVWVAKGTYLPTKNLGTTTADRDKTFILKEGVKLYGGFAGNEIATFDLANRNFTTNETILSGDFNNDDVATIDADGVVFSIINITENAHHVVVSYNLTAATVLDGFTVKGGSADETGTVTVDTDYNFSRTSGGGIYMMSSSPTLNNLVLRNNHALANGAGVYINTGRKTETPKSAEDLTVSNSLFEYNWGSELGASFTGSVGAGMVITGTSGYLYKANLTNLNFKGNWAGGLGGALRVGANVNVEVASSTFTNSRSRHGGAVYVQSNSTTPLKIIDCTFTKNFGSNGGAIEGNSATNLVIENTKFIENEGTNGGAIYILGSAGSNRSVLNIVGGEFNENSATTAGGIRVSQSVELNIDAVSFVKNVGGAINILGATDLPANVIINNTNFVENSFTEGGAIRVSTNSTLNLTNSNFKKNTSTSNGGAIFMTGLATPNISDININGGIFEENYTDGMGGALYRLTNSKLSVTNAKFIRNAPKGSGAAIYVSGNNGFEDTYNNVLFYQNNSTTSSGGGITIAGAAKAMLVGATFYENEATLGAAVRLTATTGSLKLYNSIIYNNTARTDNTHDISDAGATVEIKNTLTQVYGTDGIDGIKVGAIPLFLSSDYNDALFLVPSGDPANPILNSGDDLLIPTGVTTDLAGIARQNGIVDMGAYEFHSVLPVGLSSWTAKVQGNGVQLNWTTASETNNSHFLLAQSTDGINFTVIANVAAKGNGTKYNHTDFSPGNGVNYYRLTQVDNDGTKVTFDAIAVNFSLSGKDAVNVYPNPVKANTVTVEFKGESFKELTLVSLTGQTIQTIPLNVSDTFKTVDVAGLTKGVYILKLTREGKTILKKIIKE